MKTLNFKLADTYTGVAEITGDEVILFIEENKKVFFGMIDWGIRVSSFEIFKLSDRDVDRTTIEEERMIHGFIGRYPYRYRNIDTFDISAELKRMFETYKIRDDWEKEWLKKLEHYANKNN